MKGRIGVVALLLLALGLAGCASSISSNPAGGFRVLEAVVIERDFEPPGRDASGSWYLVFEARDGEATAHYRLPVTQEQYFRFREGASVQLTLVDYTLHKIRPIR
ncbi:MAG: hypothetical protein ACRD1B_07255, partial [Thermoanaerobaculia bacterium]